MREAEGSGGTFFDGMSHEQMLAWLDQANAGVVSGAAERLKSAADEIEKIAGELKVRPQWVSWKGSGADAFRTWAADLAAATLHLSDFSRESGTWLGHASDSIALAQSTVPRDIPTATANLAAARAAHNDPDAAGVASKSSSELAALAADREVVRLEAASEMTKLAQSYAWSAAQLNSLERPKLPPPP
ncbi:MAG TPA: translation initiation factor IF-2, partial [Streptomyces sp.]